MQVEIAKVESKWKDAINNEGDRAKVRCIKLSVEVDPTEFPDALSFDGAKMYLYRNQAEANEGEVIIASDLKEQLKTLFKSGFDVLNSI